MPERITLIDVARHAGVSRATVSLVLRNSTLVAETTKMRVLESVEAVGYLYNRGAATMRASGTKTIGLLINQIDNPFFAELTAGVSEALDAAGYIAFLSVTDDVLQRQERAILRLREHGVDGLILCPAVGTKKEGLLRLVGAGMHVVQVMRFVPGRVADYAGPANIAGLQLLAEHLVEKGHRRIAYAGGLKKHSANRQRMAGVVGVLKRRGLPEPLLLNTESTRLGGMQAAEELCAFVERPTAVICGNDVTALGLMAGLQQRGIIVGRDIAVTGVGDIPEAAACRPGLTTLATTPRTIGSEATRLLLHRITNPDAGIDHVEIGGRLMIRESSCMIVR